MAQFEKGNEYRFKPGVDNGRSRDVSPTDEELIALGKELIEWVSNPDPVAQSRILHLKQWYTIIKGISYKKWKAMIQIPAFLPYYEKAHAFISIKYIDDTIDKSIANRFLRCYFGDLRDEENETYKLKAGTLGETLLNTSDILERTAKGMIKLPDEIDKKL